MAPSTSPRGTAGTSDTIDVIDVALSPGYFPRTASFAGAAFTVTAARVSNIHPYTLFGEPRPAEQLYGIVTIEAENAMEDSINYTFGPEAFFLRTWSAQWIAAVDPIGTFGFSRLSARERATDSIAFPLPSIDAFVGAALLIGQPPDAVAVLTLTADRSAGIHPANVLATGAHTVETTPVAWMLVEGHVTLDKPPGLCCPATGVRADVGELFLVVTLRGTVRGSPYGQAAITSNEVKLLVDGTELEPLRYEGKAGVREGSSFEFDAEWLIHDGAESVELIFGKPGATRTMALEIKGGS